MSFDRWVDLVQSRNFVVGWHVLGCARDALDIFLAPVHTRTDLLYCACGSVRFRVPVLVGFSRSSRVCLWLPVARGLLGISITGLPIPETRAYTLTWS